jgi:hypothetical protein
MSQFRTKKPMLTVGEQSFSEKDIAETATDFAMTGNVASKEIFLAAKNELFKLTGDEKNIRMLDWEISSIQDLMTRIESGKSDDTGDAAVAQKLDYIDHYVSLLFKRLAR